MWQIVREGVVAMSGTTIEKYVSLAEIITMRVVLFAYMLRDLVKHYG
jgi:hypothetical protein